MNAVFMALMLTVTLGMAAQEAAAHAVHAQSPSGVHPQVVAFEYATGDIPIYVQVEVYGPGNNDVEFQNGRTDALGRFTFTPDRPGVWAVIMSDGMGHQLRHEVLVPESLFTNAAKGSTTPEANAAPHMSSGTGTSSANGATSAPASTEKAGPSTAWKALVGVSVLCNIFLGIALWRRRTTPPTAS